MAGIDCHSWSASNWKTDRKTVYWRTPEKGFISLLFPIHSPLWKYIVPAISRSCHLLHTIHFDDKLNQHKRGSLVRWSTSCSFIKRHGGDQWTRTIRQPPQTDDVPKNADKKIRKNCGEMELQQNGRPGEIIRYWPGKCFAYQVAIKAKKFKGHKIYWIPNWFHLCPTLARKKNYLWYSTS